MQMATQGQRSGSLHYIPLVLWNMRLNPRDRHARTAVRGVEATNLVKDHVFDGTTREPGIHVAATLRLRGCRYSHFLPVSEQGNHLMTATMEESEDTRVGY